MYGPVFVVVSSNFDKGLEVSDEVMRNALHRDWGVPRTDDWMKWLKDARPGCFRRVGVDAAVMCVGEDSR